MDSSIWHSAKLRDCGNLFTPRSPTETPLYRIVFAERENLEYRWDDLFAQRYGPLFDYQLKALDAFLNCGIFRHGYNCYNLPEAENTEPDNPTSDEPPEELLPPERRPISRYWASWIAKIFEVDPLECPKCQGRMKVKAIIHKPSEIERICTHLGIKAWQPPAPLQPP